MTADATDRVSARMLRDALDDTRELLRAEMALLRERLDRHERKLERICQRLDQRPAQRWLGGRVTSLLDKTIPLAVVALVTYLITHV